MPKVLKEKRDEFNKYLKNHPKSRVAFEYINSFILMSISAILGAFAFKVFLSPNVDGALPLVSGGSSGLARSIATIVNMITGEDDTYLVYSIAYTIVNIPVLYLAFRHIGLRFGIFTTLNVVAVSLLTNFINIPFLDNLARSVACVFQQDGIYYQAGLLARTFIAGVIGGASASISFAAGGSDGGVDTVSYYLSLRKSVNIGRYIVVINFAIFILFASLNMSQSIMQNGYKAEYVADAFLILIFATIYSFVTSSVIDLITRNNKKEQIEIITKEENLSKLLLANIPHGATILHAKGAFTGEDRIIIYIIVSTFETKSVINLVRNADPKSFINVTDVKQVYGRFYKPKIK